MLTEKELSNAPATRASILMKTGACVGGTIIGYLSQWIGRRRAMFISAIMSCLLVPAWILPTTERSLSASGCTFNLSVSWTRTNVEQSSCNFSFKELGV